MVDYAKYPFTDEAAEFVRQWEVNVSDLANPEYSAVLERADERVEEALVKGVVSWIDTPEYEVEVLSYPTALLLVSVVGDAYLKRRYALAEAKRASSLLEGEEDEKIVSIARNSFRWRVRRVDSTRELRYFDFALFFVDYLKHAPGFHADEWKLVNRVMTGGEVFLRREELVRLMEEEVRRRIEERIDSSPKVELPEALGERLRRIALLLGRFRERFELEEQPEGVVVEAFPPCIRGLYSALLSKQHLSHMGRLTLTSFLLNVGMSPEELIKLYTSLSDFDERMTRYQVLHIAGEKGSRTKYTPPKCSTLRTHGLCIEKDWMCDRVKHPLGYYRWKLKRLKPSERGEEHE